MTDRVATFREKDVRLHRKRSCERISKGKQTGQKPSNSTSTKTISSGSSDNQHNEDNEDFMPQEKFKKFKKTGGN